MIKRLAVRFLRLLIRLRYRVKKEGLRTKEMRRLRKEGGVIFLPNHPALVDPLILVTQLWAKWRVRPMIVETNYFLPGMHWFFKNWLQAVKVPDFRIASNSYKLMRAERALEEVLSGLDKGQNFVIYPAGRLKRQPEERLGGASALYDILQRRPETKVVLVRSKGLWGSVFGWGVTGKQPYLTHGFAFGAKTILRNLIFFVPKRKVTLEFQPAPEDFPVNQPRATLNRWLEEWYNRPLGPFATPGDPLTLVSYSFWKRDFPEVTYRRPVQTAEVDEIPFPIRRRVLREVARLSHRKMADIKPEMHLFTDLGLDSLDIAELITAFDREKALASGTSIDLLTVGALMAIAADKFTVVAEEPSLPPIDKWEKSDSSRPDPQLPEGKTLIQAFLASCDRMGSAVACADDALGTMTYADLKVRVVILAELFRTMPSARLGVMFPASTGALIVIMAVLLAKKTPVMINWTVGPRYLDAMKGIAEIDTVITSFSFLNKLEGADITPLHSNILTLESLRPRIKLKDKLRGKKLAKLSADQLLTHFGADKIDADDEAVILFTSGTEAAPKGVPLSHHNILSNQRMALPVVDFQAGDAIMCILPPFHSLGFTVTTLIPTLTGVRAVYFPNPADGIGMTHVIARYRPTVLCAAPTFLRGLFSSATPEQLASLRLYVSGAEKAPDALFEQVEQLGSHLVEGYGITECGPVLTLNKPDAKGEGVGPPLKGVELRIVSLETYKPLPPNQVGLVLARGENVFRGYLGWNSSHPFIALEGKEWYDTGDLGSIDEEGFLTLAGRLKRFVKIGGEMISLPAMETALNQAMRDQNWGDNHHNRMLAVVGTEVAGRRPTLFLFSNFPVDIDVVNETLKDMGFSNLARVGAVHEMQQIPVMGSGKYNYRLLQEKANQLEESMS